MSWIHFPQKTYVHPAVYSPSVCVTGNILRPSGVKEKFLPGLCTGLTHRNMDGAISCYLLTVSPTDNQTELSPWIILFPEVCTPSCCFPSQHSVFFWRCSVSVQVLFHFLLTSAWSPAVPPPPHPPNAYSGLSYLGAQFFVDRLTAVCKALN